MPDPFPFDAVVFDLDGTLLATDRFWIAAAEAGARRAFAELGIERELPSGDDWMGLVGLPLAQGFDALFADLDAVQRKAVMARCVEEEERALAAGGAALLPGVPEALEELRARGVALGIASNCAQPYLDSAMHRLRLADFVSEARCLDSRGVRNKADMVRDLLWTFGTRSAVMVGDRAGDRDAAHANGLPHVHLASGFAPRGERVECEAVIGGFDELLPRLERRNAWILGALEALGCFASAPPRAIGITGPPASGKTLFARDAARLLAARGVAGEVVALEDVIAQVRTDPARFDPARTAAGFDLAPLRARIDAGRGLALVEGPFLLHAAFAGALDRLVRLELPDELCAARLRARHAPLGEREELERALEVALPIARVIESDSRSRADLVLDASNPLGPAATAPRTSARRPAQR